MRFPLLTLALLVLTVAISIDAKERGRPPQLHVASRPEPLTPEDMVRRLETEFPELQFSYRVDESDNTFTVTIRGECFLRKVEASNRFDILKEAHMSFNATIKFRTIADRRRWWQQTWVREEAVKVGWYKRALRLPLCVPAVLLRATLLNSAGNFYEDRGYWPR